MVKYDLIKELENQGLLQQCIKKGVISTTTAFHKLIYESFVKYREDDIPIMLSYTMTAEDVGMSEETVIKVVSDFKK